METRENRTSNKRWRAHSHMEGKTLKIIINKRILHKLEVNYLLSAGLKPKRTCIDLTNFLTRSLQIPDNHLRHIG